MHKNILTVVGITILFLGTCITPSVAIDNAKKSINLLLNGNTLYVGGSGEGNYTSIQEAINDASDGDTVFVYNGTYFEDLKINTSIVLQGEDKESTIIHGGGFGSGDGVVLVSADNVEITGFSVRNSCPYWPGSGIRLHSNEQCIVTDNIISDCFLGISTLITSSATISMNTVSDTEFGIYVQGSKRNIITRNTIQNNHCGMYLNDADFNEITENNFIENERHFGFYGVFQNKINGNYWERFINIGPKFLLGRKFFLIPFLSGFIIDWHPAKLPYVNMAESASVVVRASNSKIKMTLVCGGQNYPSSGYSFAIDVTIRLNGTVLPESNLEGNTGWEVGESLYIGGSTPILDDEESAVDPLNSGDYTITITIIETVIFDDIVTIV